jgi:hypothetical protein
MRSTADVTGGKAIAVILQSISGVIIISPSQSTAGHSHITAPGLRASYTTFTYTFISGVSAINPLVAFYDIDGMTAHEINFDLTAMGLKPVTCATTYLTNH